MGTIRLLAASNDSTPIPELESQSTSLVPISSQALAALTTPRSDAAYPDDSYTWTASAGSDGTFTFYAVPQQKSGNNGASSQWGNDTSNSGWNTQALRFAAAQYALSASLPPPMYGSANAPGSLINVYA
jgi:hypothetical protein